MVGSHRPVVGGGLQPAVSSGFSSHRPASYHPVGLDGGVALASELQHVQGSLHVANGALHQAVGSLQQDVGSLSQATLGGYGR